MNYVSKRYIEDVDRDVYFQDVKLQMDAKVWAEEYNRHNPPKKVCYTQLFVLFYTLPQLLNRVKYRLNSLFSKIQCVVSEFLNILPSLFSPLSDRVSLNVPFMPYFFISWVILMYSRVNVSVYEVLKNSAGHSDQYCKVG